MSQQETKRSLKLDDSWKTYLEEEFDQEYMIQLRAFLQQEKKAGKEIFPSGENIFAALNATPFEKVKVVVLGQDPYHGVGQAHGLSFSVPKGNRIPPSLLNIYKEIKADLGIDIPSHGCLEEWAEQGVLLLNAVLTVEKAQAASHQGKGWERFTDRVVTALNEQREGLVFLLWGSYAHKKGQFIDQKKHLVLRSAHPSPLSAHRGFLGNRHFSKTNEYLVSKGEYAINWSIQS